MVRWLVRLAVAAAAGVILFLGYAVLLTAPPVARAVNSPEFCAGCHVMAQQYASHAQSSHRGVTCNGCHVSHGFLSGAWSEAQAGSRHLWIFVTGTTPDPIAALRISRDRIQENCVRCHGGMIRSIGDTHRDGGVYCFSCHRSTPHERPYLRGER